MAIGDVADTMRTVFREYSQGLTHVLVHEGAISRSKTYGELGDIVSGKIRRRENEEETITYESVGIAALDVAVAAMAH